MVHIDVTDQRRALSSLGRYQDQQIPVILCSSYTHSTAHQPPYPSSSVEPRRLLVQGARLEAMSSTYSKLIKDATKPKPGAPKVRLTHIDHRTADASKACKEPLADCSSLSIRRPSTSIRSSPRPSRKMALWQIAVEPCHYACVRPTPWSSSSHSSSSTR